MNLKTLFLAVALLAVTPMCFAAQFAIDDFNVQLTGTIGGLLIDAAGGGAATANDTNVGDGNANRAVTINSLVGNNFAEIIGNDLGLSQNAGGQANYTLAYAFGASADFTGGGTNTLLQFDFTSIEANTVFENFLVTVDGTAVDLTAAINTALGLNGAQGQLNNVSFTSDFTNFAAVDFTSIDTFQLNTRFSAEKEITFSFISANAVPEPSTYFMIALLGLVAFVRGRKKMVVENK